MLFSSIPGLAETKTKIIQSIHQNKMAHAILFHGPEGSPNMTLALALATYVNCADPTDEDACGECASCQKMEKLIHPDLNFAFPVPGSLIKESEEENKKVPNILVPWRDFVIKKPYGNIQDWIAHNGFDKQLNISKAAARQMIRTLSLKSFEGGYKIMLIWAPEYMHNNAANALLKILEEPPAQTLFLLVSNHPEQLLTTILSRTQKILIRFFSDEEIRAHLIDSGICSPEKAEQVAPLADGNMREAYFLVEEVVDENTVKFRDWMRICFSLDIPEMVNLADSLLGKDKESQKALLLGGLTVLRECLLNKSQLDGLMRTALADREFIQKLGQSVLTEEKIASVYELLNEAHYHLERNANQKILFLDLSFNIARVLRK